MLKSLGKTAQTRRIKKTNLNKLKKPEDPTAGTATPEPGRLSSCYPRLSWATKKLKSLYNRTAAIDNM